MPAVSVSSLMSWGAYLGAAASLVLLMNPLLNGISSGSRVAAASRTMDGVAEVFNGLRPGVSVSLTYHSQELTGGITLNGHQFTGIVDSHKIVRDSTWDLPEAILLPDRTYTITLENGSTEVSSTG